MVLFASTFKQERHAHTPSPSDWCHARDVSYSYISICNENPSTNLASISVAPTMSRTVSDSLGSYKKSNIQLVQLCLSKMERQNIWLRVYWGYILCPESQYGVLTQIFYRTSHSYLEFAKLKSQTNKVHFAKNTLRTNILQYFGQIHFGRKYEI